MRAAVWATDGLRVKPVPERVSESMATKTRMDKRFMACNAFVIQKAIKTYG